MFNIQTEDGLDLLTEDNQILVTEADNPPSNDFWNALTGLSGITGGGKIDH